MAISGEGVISPLSLESYKESILSQWKTELHNRIIPNYMDEVRECVRLHGEDATDYDIDNWLEIHRLKVYIAKNSLERKSLLSLSLIHISRSWMPPCRREAVRQRSCRRTVYVWRRRHLVRRPRHRSRV